MPRTTIMHCLRPLTIETIIKIVIEVIMKLMPNCLGTYGWKKNLLHKFYH